MARGQHRITRNWTCPCGRFFAEIRKRPHQQFCSKQCSAYRTRGLNGRMAAAKQQRDALIRKGIRAIAERGRITEAALIELGRDLYKRGYWAGYYARRHNDVATGARDSAGEHFNHEIGDHDHGADEPESDHRDDLASPGAVSVRAARA